jgi:hypothetical protein
VQERGPICKGEEGKGKKKVRRQRAEEIKKSRRK